MHRPGLALALLVLAAGCRHLPGGAAPPLFTLADPRGDDHGDGDLVYPVGADVAPGDLDLVSLSARREGQGTLFTATFARPVARPPVRPIDDVGTMLTDVARLGFYTLNLDLYVTLDREPGSGEVRMLPGRKAEVAPEFAWEVAIVLTPQPAEARAQLRKIWAEEDRRRAGEQRSLGAREVADLEAAVETRVAKVFFPTRVRVLGNAISFYVPPEVFGGPAQPGQGYVVAVSGAEIATKVDLGAFFGRGQTPGLHVRGIAPGPPREGRFGGGREHDPLQPPLVDVVVPPGGPTQEEVLRGDPDHPGAPRRVPGVVPREAVR